MSVENWRKYFNEDEVETGVDRNDIAKIREAIPELSGAPAIKIHKAWEAFSDDYCASYLLVSDHTIQDFKEWLELK